MITNDVTKVRKWDYTEHLACENCGKNQNLRRTVVKNGGHSNEMCFCNDCWNEIMVSVWPFQAWRHKGSDNEPHQPIEDIIKVAERSGPKTDEDLGLL